MASLLLALLLLHIGGIRGEERFLYFIPGEDAILPCEHVTGNPPPCDQIEWLYNNDSPETGVEFREGQPSSTSPRFNRLHLSHNCSLHIFNITREDVGRYTCRNPLDASQATTVYVSILSISLSPPNADPNKDEEVTLACVLSQNRDIPQCEMNGPHWVNKDGDLLEGEGDGFTVQRKTGCVSYLTVKTEHKRRYSCEYSRENVKIKTSYSNGRTTDPFGLDQTVIPIVGAAVGFLVVIVVVATLLFKCRRQSKAKEDVQKLSCMSDETNVTSSTLNQPGTNSEARDETTLNNSKKDGTENNVIYASLNHGQTQVPPRMNVKDKKEEKKEEEVTYSAIKTR